MKRKIDTKKLVIGCAAVVVLVLVIAVLAGTKPREQMSDKYDKTVVIETSKQAIEYFNQRDYDDLLDMGTEEYTSSNTVESLSALREERLGTYGAFVKYYSEKSMGGTNPETGEEYGGALITVVYEKGRATFSIGFNEDMELRQFLIQ